MSSIPKSLDGADNIAPPNELAMPLPEQMLATSIGFIVLMPNASAQRRVALNASSGALCWASDSCHQLTKVIAYTTRIATPIAIASLLCLVDPNI